MPDAAPLMTMLSITAPAHEERSPRGQWRNRLRAACRHGPETRATAPDSAPDAHLRRPPWPARPGSDCRRAAVRLRQPESGLAASGRDRRTAAIAPDRYAADRPGSRVRRP